MLSTVFGVFAIICFACYALVKVVPQNVSLGVGLISLTLMLMV
jgi:hypothetical protein